MKEIWAYVRWQHKISGNGVLYIGMYTMLGSLAKYTGDDLVLKLMILFLLLAIWGMNFRSLYEKNLKKQEQVLPISQIKKITGLIVYFIITLLLGIGIVLLSMNIYMFYIFVGIVVLVGLKNGTYSKENLENTDLRKWFKRR